MPAYDKETVTLECPGCKREMEVTFYDVYSRREAKCRRCGSSYKFDSSAASNLQRALQERERAEKKLEEAMGHMYDKADIQIKR